VYTGRFLGGLNNFVHALEGPSVFSEKRPFASLEWLGNSLIGEDINSPTVFSAGM